MPLRPRTLRLATVVILLLSGAGASFAQDNVFGEPAPHRVRVVRRVYRALPPPPPPALVNGYLPRNHAVPLYNEPPGFRPPGSFGR